MNGQDLSLRVGSILNERYTIGDEVGRGGYSVVYKAQDRQLGTTVAIKLLIPPPAAAILAKERLRREVVALQKLNHPSIIRIYDLHENDHWSFLIMEFIEGSTLDQHVARHGPLSQEHAIHVGRQLADALAVAHRHGIVHRDVKPQNIMLTRGFHAVLTDFGSAKIEGQATVTATGAFVGTMDYLAPEVFQGARSDGRSDIYALGMCLFVAMAGRLPDGGSNHQPPPPDPEGFRPSRAGVNISDEFDRIIAQTTMADPGDRFHTADGLAKALNGEWQPPVATTNRQLKFCLRCGGPDFLELSVCPSCQAHTDRGNTYIFVEQGLGASEREAVGQLLHDVTGLSKSASSVSDTVRGVRSLLQVTETAAPAIVAKLKARNIPVSTATLRQAWSRVPVPLRGLMWANLLVGVWAGFFQTPTLLWLSPLFFGVTFLAIGHSIRQPLIRPSAKPLCLPKELERDVFTTLVSLPAGAALDLFADIARTGSTLYETVKRDSLDPLLTQRLVSSLKLSSAVASDLSQLDQTLLDISKHAHSNPSQRNLANLMGRCEAHRDKLVQKLLELLSSLAAMAAVEGGRYDSALQELERVTKELEEDVRVQQEAAKEVRAYLGDSEKEEHSYV